MLAVHVDDMIVAGTSPDCDRLHEHLTKGFPTNNPGDLTNLTDSSFKRDRQNNSMTVSQKAYID